MNKLTNSSTSPKLVKPLDAGQRLDAFIAMQTGITRSQIQKLIEQGDVLVNSRQSSQNYRVKAGDAVSIRQPEKPAEGLLPEAIPIEVLYIDDYLIVVNKPAGMVLYPSAGHYSGTLMNALAYHCKKLASIGGPLRPGVVHRLDRDTSGVMVVALDDRAYYNLVEQFRERKIKRKYKTLVYGNLKDDSGEITSLIGRSEADRKKMSTKVRRGKEAVTRWRSIKRFGCATLVEAHLGTGRTHQIRVHFASIGHPVLGDRTYGKKTTIDINNKRVVFPRQMLHAELLGFIHPITKEHLELSSPLPDDMKEVMSVFD
ncbi:MAG: RluA family pseudouridine synthase [Nitrospirota bacterium]